jgi:ssDNA-binding Zn-finger/Zn-ribbon topoisomerase 1
VGEIEDCPDCGKPLVREATKKEKEEFIKYQNEKDKLNNRYLD